jgi:hypothetical protein
MGIVAVCTTFGSCFVYYTFFCRVIVTTNTEFFRGFKQQRTIFRAVRIVATQAAFVFYSSVNHITFRRFIMTLEAEALALLNQNKAVLVTVIIVAGRAIVLLEWRVQLPPFSCAGLPFCMALGTTLVSLDRERSQ